MSTDENTEVTAQETDTNDCYEVRIHAEMPFKNGDVVPETYWKTFFENDHSSEEVSALTIVESILRNEGDHIYLKGSTVERILYGIYLFDKEKETIPGTLKSDLDIVIPSADLYGSLNNRIPEACATESKYVSKTLKSGSAELGIIELERLRQMHEAGLLELENWANTLDDVSLRGYFVDRAAQLTDLLKLGDLQLLDAAFYHEAISLKLERKDGKLEAVVIDAGNLLQNEEYLNELENTRAAGNPLPPFKFYENHDSTVLLYLEALGTMADYEFKDSVFPLMATGIVSRVIKADTQDHMFFHPYYNDKLWNNMYTLCERVHHGEPIYSFTGKVQDYYSDKGLIASESMLIPDVQAGFLKGCKNDPIRAYGLVFQQLPLGFVFSEDVHALFSEFHTQENKGQVVTDAAYYEPTFANLGSAAKSKARWGTMVMSELDWQEATPVTVVGVDGEEHVAGFPTYGKSFEDINEVFGMLFASFDWHAEPDTEKLRSVLDNWTGLWNDGAGWALNPEVQNFNTNIDIDKIKARIEELRKEYSYLYE